jgi:predicted RNA-binding Zn-ribbon protein involved in translation (DUF1610 family)
MAETKICPYCGEEILAVAIKCKHCGNWLDDNHKVGSPGTMRCPVCDEVIPADSTVCPQCGETIANYLSENTGAEVSAVVEEEGTTQLPSKNDKFQWWIPLIIFVVMGLFLLFDNCGVISGGIDDGGGVPSANTIVDEKIDGPAYVIENKSEVLSLVRSDECFIPRSTEVGVLFRRYYNCLQYMESNDIEFSEHSTVEDYWAAYYQSIDVNPDGPMEVGLSSDDVERICNEAKLRREYNNEAYYAAEHNEQYKDLFNASKKNFDESFKAQIVYDYLCLHWNYRDVDSIENLYTLFSEEDFYNYYQDWISFNKGGAE